jgi:aminodeoxyfutalosine synthase
MVIEQALRTNLAAEPSEHGDKPETRKSPHEGRHESIQHEPWRRSVPEKDLSFAPSVASSERMSFHLQRSGLRDLYDKVVAGERISETDALRLFESKDLNAVGAIADFVRQRKVGQRANYIINRYINYSNYCILSCQFCAFAKKKRDADGFQLTTEQIVEKAREALRLGITELHIVGGLHPSLPFSYYTDMLHALKTLDARLQLKCFTAIEILHLAWLAKKSVEQTLRELKDAGLASLTGGGAEIFRKEVRSQIAKGKESAEEYLDVHRTWHRLGGRSTCTMLYGHVESLEDRVDHLRQLRALQDETHGFTGFVPLAYQPDNNRIEVKHPPTGFDSLRTIAVSRIYLDNFDHITAYWVGLGLKLAQVALSYGADDLHGTIIEEHIFHMAGAKSPQLQTEAEMVKAIREAGRTPVQRNTFYEPIRIVEGGTSNSTPNGNEHSPVLETNLTTA